MSDNYNWGTPLSDLNGHAAEQRRSPAAPNYNTYNPRMYGTGAWVRAEEVYQSVPYSGTQPMFNTDMSMADGRDPQPWSDQEWLQRFYRSGGGREGAAQETFLWQPTASLHHWDNAVVSSMLSGNPVVDMQRVSNFMTDADQFTLSPHSNTNPRASNTYQSVNQLSPPSQGSAINHVGFSSYALATRVVPLPSLVPPARQERHPIAHGRSAADTASVRTGPVNHLPDPSMYHVGQARPGTGAQHLGANSNQAAVVFCPVPTCRKQFRDQVGLQKHSKIHSGEGPRYPCDRPGCDYVGRWPKDLLNHMLTHDKSEVPNVLCEVPGCDRGFSRRDNYLRHLRKNHADSRTAAAILGRSARPDRLPRLPQPTKPSARKSKKSATEASASRAPSHASESSGLSSSGQHGGPALPYRGRFSAPEPNQMRYGMSASTSSNMSSLWTPETAGSTSVLDGAAFSPGPGSSYSAPRG